MAKFDIGGFLRECYLNAEPSIDLRSVSETINPSEYKLKLSVYNRLLHEWGVTDADGNAIDEQLLLGVGFFCMDKGPTWVDDTAELSKVA